MSKTPEETALERIREAKKSEAGTLDLKELGLKDLPEELWELTNLKELHLQGNNLSALSAKIADFVNLSSLDISNEPFARPGRPRNRIARLPDELWKLPELRKLNISFNAFAEIPDTLWQKKGWELLGLGGFKLASLPPEIVQLQNLTTLYLSGNQLASLPPEIVQLQNLTDIGLHGNPLEIALPTRWLGSQYFGNNEAQKILAYYKELDEEGGNPLGEVRVMVVGEANAGKTKLLRALLKGEVGESFVDARNPTDGIEVNTFGGDDIALRFWDFGGQEIMHATHRFFLSRRCVYILAADSSQDRDYNEEKIEYWLELIKFFGGDSPVMLVATKAEQFSLDVNQSRLQEKYPNLVKSPILHTSAKSGQGIQELHKSLFELAKKLPTASVILPKSFLAVKDALEKMKEDEKVKVIEDAIYRKLCAENGISEEERQDTLLQLLHDMGVVLHYEDDERLSDFGILNPDWATGGVYKIVTNTKIKESRGRFALRQVEEFLNDKEKYPPSMRRRIVDLMKKFELSYEIPLEKDTFILPSALPADQPALDGWDKPAMTFEYRYRILQVNVLHRFMVTNNDLISGGQIWYSGVVLKKGDNQCLVRADFRDKKINIKVKGVEETRKDFLYFIRTQFERIHGEEVKPDEYIYPAQYPELPLRFDDMKTLAKSEKDYKAVYKGQAVTINLRELLDGFVTAEERHEDEKRDEKEPGRERGGSNTYINNTINVQGDMMGNATVGNENMISSITNPAFKEELGKLTKEVKSLLQKLEDTPNKEELKENLENLQEEMERPKPRKKFYQVSVEGLAQSARNLNEVGKPVLELAMTIIKLLHSMP